MTIDREAVFQAVADLTTKIKWGPLVLGIPSKQFINPVALRRRVKLFSDVDATQQPAIFQAEHDERVAQAANLPYKQLWKCSWIVYQDIGLDPGAVPAVENNLILDAMFAALAPTPIDPGFDNRRNTLNGLVYSVVVDGDIFKDPGDIDNQGMIVLPISILVP